MRVDNFEFYYPQDPDNPAAQAYRWLFFEVLRGREELRPILETLRDDVLPIYEMVDLELSRAGLTAQARRERRALTLWPQFGLDEGETYACVTVARNALYKWANKYGLRPYRWAIFIAWRAIVLWGCSPQALADLHLWPGSVTIGAGGKVLAPAVSNLILPGWLPLQESWDEFENSSSQHLRAWLKDQKELGETLPRQGYKRLLNTDYLEHLTYLAFYICLRMGPQSIAKLPGLAEDKTVISKHLKSAADLIGVSVRTPGRPRKRRNAP